MNNAQHMRCKSCEGTVETTWRFCPKCGQTLTHDRAPSSTAEKRQVSVVFVDLVASTKLARTLSSDAYFDLMGEILTVLAYEIEAQGGEVLQFQGDAVLAAFGARHETAFGDDAVRALRAAKSALQAIETFGARMGLGLRGRAGVATDVATAGWVGGEFTVFGSVVNHARRLSSAAEPGTVLVSEDTRGLACSVAQFEVSCVQVRDYSDYTPHILSAFFDHSQASVLGRDQEMQVLTEQLEAVVASGTARHVDVTGFVGSGKSSLLEAFAALAEARGVRVLREPAARPDLPVVANFREPVILLTNAALTLPDHNPVLVLRELPQGAGTAQADAVIHLGAFNPQEARRLLERGLGVLRASTAQGLYERAAGQVWVLSLLAGETSPLERGSTERVRRVIESRLEALPVDLRQWLILTAVMGEISVAALRSDSAYAPLEALSQSGWLSRDARGLYRVAVPLVREVAAMALSEPVAQLARQVFGQRQWVETQRELVRTQQLAVLN